MAPIEINKYFVHKRFIFCATFIIYQLEPSANIFTPSGV